MGRVPSQQEPEVLGRGLPASPNSQTRLWNPASHRLRQSPAVTVGTVASQC